MSAVFLGLGMELEAVFGGIAPRTTLFPWFCSRGPGQQLEWVLVGPDLAFKAACDLDPPTRLPSSPAMPVCTKALCSATPVSQLTGRLLEVIKIFL